MWPIGASPSLRPESWLRSAVGRMAEVGAAAQQPLGRPLPHVADDVVQPERVGLERVDGHRAGRAVREVRAAERVRALEGPLVAPRVARRDARARRRVPTARRSAATRRPRRRTRARPRARRARPGGRASATEPGPVGRSARRRRAPRATTARSPARAWAGGRPAGARRRRTTSRRARPRSRTRWRSRTPRTGGW